MTTATVLSTVEANAATYATLVTESAITAKCCLVDSDPPTMTTPLIQLTGFVRFIEFMVVADEDLTPVNIMYMYEG